MFLFTRLSNRVWHISRYMFETKRSTVAWNFTKRQGKTEGWFVYCIRNGLMGGAAYTATSGLFTWAELFRAVLHAEANKPRTCFSNVAFSCQTSRGVQRQGQQQQLAFVVTSLFDTAARLRVTIWSSTATGLCLCTANGRFDSRTAVAAIASL